MRRTWKSMPVICCALVVAIAATVAEAATGGGSKGVSKADVPAPPNLPGPRRHLEALAKELGVSTNDLRTAFQRVREKLGPPEALRRGERPSRTELVKRCTEVTDALAKELGKSGDEVRAATRAVVKAQIEQAVKDNRLSRDQADKIIDRIDDRCLPPVGPPGLIGVGCAKRHGGPPGGFGGRAFPGGTEAPAPPPGAFMLE